MRQTTCPSWPHAVFQHHTTANAVTHIQNTTCTPHTHAHKRARGHTHRHNTTTSRTQPQATHTITHTQSHTNERTVCKPVACRAMCQGCIALRHAKAVHIRAQADASHHVCLAVWRCGRGIHVHEHSRASDALVDVCRRQAHTVRTPHQHHATAPRTPQTPCGGTPMCCRAATTTAAVVASSKPGSGWA